jgi:hypothetical protein
MEVLVTLAENKPGLCRKLTGFAKTILEILLKMMLEVHDISLDEWNKQVRRFFILQFCFCVGCLR